MPEIITIIGEAASLIGSVTVIAKLLKKWMFSAVSDQFKALEEKTDEQDKKIDASAGHRSRRFIDQIRRGWCLSYIVLLPGQSLTPISVKGR